MSASKLIRLYKEMAAGGDQFHGLSILQHKDQIGEIIRKHGSVYNVLDYGCGRGDAYRPPHEVHREWGLKRSDVTLFDPAFEEHDKLPARRFDMVLCCDVLEHVPEKEVDAFVERLFDKARFIVWASVCCRPARKTFPQTGENLHVCVKPMQWWYDTFNEYANGKHFVLVESP